MAARFFQKRFLAFACLLIVTCAKMTAQQSFFGTVGTYLDSMETVMDNVVGGLEKVIAGVRTVENVFNDAIDGDCHYNCKNGAKPKKNPNHIPHSNGCGSLGLKLGKNDLPISQLTKCCDDHDICYDTCNSDKDDCDRDFKKCLYRLCDKYIRENEKSLLKRCKAAAKFMFMGTIALGCTPFRDAQQNACLCERSNTEL